MYEVHSIGWSAPWASDNNGDANAAATEARAVTTPAAAAKDVACGASVTQATATAAAAAAAAQVSSIGADRSVVRGCALGLAQRTVANRSGATITRGRRRAGRPLADKAAYDEQQWTSGGGCQGKHHEESRFRNNNRVMDRRQSEDGSAASKERVRENNDCTGTNQSAPRASSSCSSPSASVSASVSNQRANALKIGHKGDKSIDRPKERAQETNSRPVNSTHNNSQHQAAQIGNAMGIQIQRYLCDQRLSDMGPIHGHQLIAPAASSSLSPPDNRHYQHPIVAATELPMNLTAGSALASDQPDQSIVKLSRHKSWPVGALASGASFASLIADYYRSFVAGHQQSGYRARLPLEPGAASEAGEKPAAMGCLLSRPAADQASQSRADGLEAYGQQRQSASLHRLGAMASVMQQHYAATGGQAGAAHLGGAPQEPPAPQPQPAPQYELLGQQAHHYQTGGRRGPAKPSTGLAGGSRRREGPKCRKMFGMEQRDYWCTQCKWKKACSRFGRHPMRRFVN